MAHLIDKDALVAEIERRFQKYWKRGEESDALQDGNAKYWGGVLSCLNEVKTLINTLEAKEVQEEPVSKDLEEAAWLQYDRNKPLMPPELDLHKELIDFFKAGAEWQMLQLTKDAIKTDVKADKDGLYTDESWDEMNGLLQKIGAKDGDKVKLIIIKEE